MEIQKHFNRKVLQEYFFIEGIIDIDCDYFITKIKGMLKIILVKIMII